MSEEINTGKRGISDTYVVIQGWMVRELGLRGNDLFVFAQIYNYSQDGKSRFYGSIEYLQSWTNSTRQGIIRNLEVFGEIVISRGENNEDELID